MAALLMVVAWVAVAGVPSAAVPPTGAPVPPKLQGRAAPAGASPTLDVTREVPPSFPEYTPPRRRGLHPMSVFSRPSAASKQGKPAKQGKRKRDPNHHFLPLPHVSSQPATGLMLGGSLNYSYRKPGQLFNQAYLLAWSRVSTRGVQDHILQGRLRNTLGHSEVFQFGGLVLLDPVFAYYGINNHENIGGTDITGPYNRMRMENYGGFFSYEHPLWMRHRPGRPVGILRHYSGVFYYVDVKKGYEGSRLLATDPELVGTDRRGIVRGGLSWDSRDNDWSPQEGSLIDVTFDVAGPFTGSTSTWGRAHATVRNYWPLGDSKFLIAHRVTFDGLFGQAPLMALGEFGGLFPMDAYGGAFVGRGFGRRRFAANFKATAGAEIRYVPIEFGFGRHHIGLGIESFFELGLASMRIADLFKNWYPSGGPGLLFIWDRFVVFRVEAGFSREGSAIYLQSDHAF